MKRILLALAAAMIIASSACAQRLSDIRLEASFITDKMVAELGLTKLQRNSILQLNINYLNGICSYRDISADGWKYRNKQMKRILSEKQWKRYKDAYYFYRPIGWKNSAYVHNIYAKYPKCRFDCKPERPCMKPRKPQCRPDFKEKRFDRGKHKGNTPRKAAKRSKDMRRGFLKGTR